MRKLDPRSQTKIANVLLAGQRKISLHGLARRHAQLFASASALCCAATVSAIALLASSPASAQFMCTTTPSDSTCTNSGTAPTPFTNNAAVANQNAGTTNTGTAHGFASQTTGGGNATVINSGTNTLTPVGMLAQTVNGGNATATNSGNDTGTVKAITFVNGNATATNTGTIAGATSGLLSQTNNGGTAVTTNSGSVGSGVTATAFGPGDATATNSGSAGGGVGATTKGGGNAIATNSGTTGPASATLAFATKTGDATAINSGTSNGVGAAAQAGNATVVNSGTSTFNPVTKTGGLAAATVVNGNATVTNSGSNLGGGILAATSGVGNATVANSGTNTNGNVEAITGLVTPRLRVRYVGGELDGFSESGSMQNLSVGRRAINDLEERAEVELSTVSGALKATANVGVIGLERLGNPNINTVLLAQNLSFVTPGKSGAVGGVLGLGLQYRPLPNVTLFVAGEGTAMSDKSYSAAGTGGARVSF